MKFIKEIPPELEDVSNHEPEFHPQSCLSTLLVCIIFLAGIFLAVKCSGQQITTSLHWNMTGRESAKLAYQSHTWGVYVTTYPDVSWQQGKNTEDCFDTMKAFTFGASYQVHPIIAISAGIGRSELNHHCADDSWAQTRRFAWEFAGNTTLIRGRLLTAGLDGGLGYCNELIIFAGINIGLIIK